MRGKCRLFQVSLGFYEFITGNTENCSGVLPRRLYKAFVIDPPSLFAYLWKVRKIQNHALFGSITCTLLPSITY